MLKKIVVIALMIVTLIWNNALADDLNWAGCGITKKAFMTEIAAEYEKLKGKKINLSGGGAKKGIRDAASGKVDIGGSCRHLLPVPEEEGVKLFPVAWDALVVITHPDNPVGTITHKQLQEVFKKEITNWKELGGPDKAITVFARKGNISGVGLMARELLFGDTDVDFKANQKFPSTGPLEKAIEQTTYSIALDGISSARKRKVKVLKVNGVEPSYKNIASGKYEMFRPLYLVFKQKPSREIVEFTRFVRSEKGQAIIKKQGTVTMRDGAKLWSKYRKHMKNVKGKNMGVFE